MTEQAKVIAQNLREGWPYRGADARIMCEEAADTIDSLVAAQSMLIGQRASLVADRDQFYTEATRLRLENAHYAAHMGRKLSELRTELERLKRDYSDINQAHQGSVEQAENKHD